MHGQVAGYKSNEKSEIISIPRLKDKNIDYLALGHIHTFSQGIIDARGKYAYSGCLDGRGFDELGEKGFVLLEKTDSDFNGQFVGFSSRNLYEFEYDVTDAMSWYSTAEEIEKELKAVYDKKDIIKVILKGEHKTDFYIDKDGLSARLNEYFFFAKVYDRTTLKIDLKDYETDKSVRGEFVRAVWQSDLSPEQKHRVILTGLNALKGEEI
jgi:DNA repair exonuclease SbcCD nuclease subunit